VGAKKVLSIGMDQRLLEMMEAAGSMTPELRISLETYHQLFEGHPEWPGLWEGLKADQGDAWDEWAYMETSMEADGWVHRFKDHCGGALALYAREGYDPRVAH